MFGVNQIADWFLCAVDRDAGDSITHLKLQKLLYYAQAWSLALLNRPLFNEDFQAWTHGPVVRSVFDRFSGCGWNALPASETPHGIEDPEVLSLLADVQDIYGEMGAKELENLTHSEIPWKLARGDLDPAARSENVISKAAMRDFYKEMYEKVHVELPPQ